MRYFSKDWILQHKERLLYCGLLIVVFFIGLALPSPFFRNGLRTIMSSDMEELVDTTNMVLAGGSYSGSIVKNSNVRSGYGRYETKAGSVYEGNWKDDRLIYGTRTTPSSVYSGHFDSDLNNDGFGIINYTEEYIQGKKKQGLADSEITITYIGNWSKNNKQGIGRSIKRMEVWNLGIILKDYFKKFRAQIIE